MRATEKQIDKIIIMWENGDNKSFKRVWESIPKNNATYPNKKADYRRIIIKDFFIKSKMTVGEASYMITLLERQDGSPTFRFRTLLNKLNKRI